MYRVHLYTEADEINSLFPVQTYEYKTSAAVLKNLEDLFNNNISGISKIIIEDDSFGINFKINCMSPQKQEE